MTWEGRLKHPNIATSAIETTVYRNVERTVIFCSIRDFNARDVDHCNKLTETVAMARFRLMSQQSSR